MNPSEFITLSTSLVGRGASGARSAVSRAYYGAYHLAADLLGEMQCECTRSGRGHELVPKILRGCENNDDAQNAGGLLDDLRGHRIKADYKLGRTDIETQAFAQMSVETAKQIEVLLDAFRAACKTQSTLQELRDSAAKIKQGYRL